MISIIVAYLTSVYFFWKPSNSKHFVIVGQSLWLAIISYGCSFLGALQLPVFLFIMLYIGVSIIYQLRYIDTCPYSFLGRATKLLDRTDFEKAIYHYKTSKNHLLQHSKQSDMEDISLSDDMMDSIMEGLEACDRKESTVSTFLESKDSTLSNTYFKILFYACLATFLYRNLWMLLLSSIPTMVHLLFTVSKYTGFTDFVYLKISDIYKEIKVKILYNSIY